MLILYATLCIDELFVPTSHSFRWGVDGRHRVRNQGEPESAFGSGLFEKELEEAALGGTKVAVKRRL